MLTSSYDPKKATITIRVIKSFEYRTIRNHVFQHIDLTIWTPRKILEEIRKVVSTAGGFRAFRTTDFNAVKIYTHAHATKTQNLSINLDNDDWILGGSKLDIPLVELDVQNETELSVFNMEAYEAFKANPVQKW